MDIILYPSGESEYNEEYELGLVKQRSSELSLKTSSSMQRIKLINYYNETQNTVRIFSEFRPFKLIQFIKLSFYVHSSKNFTYWCLTFNILPISIVLFIEKSLFFVAFLFKSSI